MTHTPGQTVSYQGATIGGMGTGLTHAQDRSELAAGDHVQVRSNYWTDAEGVTRVYVARMGGPTHPVAVTDLRAI